MSDNTSKPAAVPTIAPIWAPSASEMAATQERDRITRELAEHDAARAACGTVTLTAITDFTRISDEFPKGETIRMGDEFTISEFDLPKFLGKGLPRVGT